MQGVDSSRAEKKVLSELAELACVSPLASCSPTTLYGDSEGGKEEDPELQRRGSWDLRVFPGL